MLVEARSCSAESTLRGTSLSSGPAGRELTRLDADHLPISRDAGAQVGLGEAHLRARGGEARLGLRHVGAGHLADVEAIAGLTQLLLDDFDVVALQVQDGGVAQHVHVGRGGIEQDVLLAVSQRLAGAENCATPPARTEFVVLNPLKRFCCDLEAVAARNRPRVVGSRHGAAGIGSDSV